MFLTLKMNSLFRERAVIAFCWHKSWSSSSFFSCFSLICSGCIVSMDLLGYNLHNHLHDCFICPVICQVVWLLVVWSYVKQLHPVWIYQLMHTYCNYSNENILSSDYKIKFSLGRVDSSFKSMCRLHLSIVEKENMIMCPTLLWWYNIQGK